MEKFVIGLAVGGVCGALLVANNYKIRTLVKKAQEEVESKADELMDKKIREMEKFAAETEDKIKETVENTKRKLSAKKTEK